MAMGVLTPFMLIEKYVPERHRYKILFLGAIVAGSGRIIYGFATASGGGAGSPLFQMLRSISSSDAGTMIMSSIAPYLETALIFGVILAAAAGVRKFRERGEAMKCQGAQDRKQHGGRRFPGR